MEKKLYNKYGIVITKKDEDKVYKVYKDYNNEENKNENENKNKNKIKKRNIFKNLFTTIKEIVFLISTIVLLFLTSYNKIQFLILTILLIIVNLKLLSQRSYLDI